MYSFKEAFDIMGWLPDLKPDDRIACCETDGPLTFHTNLLDGALAVFSYTIVLSGWLKIQYNSRDILLVQDDIYIYTAGFSVRVVDASPDYRGICLIADEGLTLENPNLRQSIRVAFFPVIQLQEPSFHLQPEDSLHLQELMHLAIRYYQSSDPLRQESLQMLYGLFLLSLSSAQQKTSLPQRIPHKMEDTFLKFMSLLSSNYLEHRDLAFYAAQLNITTIYLSRIVKEITGRTVVDYINQMLVNESAWLLKSTNLSVAAIADRLHFAETASFARFFYRLKGVTPTQYRKSS